MDKYISKCQTDDQRYKARYQEDRPPIAKQIEHHNYENASQTKASLDYGHINLSFLVFDDLGQKTNRQVIATLDTIPHQKEPHLSHPQSNRSHHQHLTADPDEKTHQQGHSPSDIISHKTGNNDPYNSPEIISPSSRLYPIRFITVIITKLVPQGPELTDLWLLVLLPMFLRQLADIFGAVCDSLVGGGTVGVGRDCEVVGSSQRGKPILETQYTTQYENGKLILPFRPHHLNQFKILIIFLFLLLHISFKI